MDSDPFVAALLRMTRGYAALLRMTRGYAALLRITRGYAALLRMTRVVDDLELSTKKSLREKM